MYHPEIERVAEELYFVAASPAMRRLRMQAEQLSQTDVPVLITGEHGSGKATVARLIHSLSLCSSFPFTSVDCGALTEDMLESELFGSEHTGVSGEREFTPGKFEQCGRGTVLLEELDAMPNAVQQRLLKFLQTQELVRCGGQTAIPVHVRIIAATRGRLEKAAAEKAAHEELYHRLSAFELQVPPLRDRREEIPLLLGHFMSRLTRRYGVSATRFSSTLLEACQHYPWPGNLRELENFVKRFLALGDESAAVEELHSHSDFETAPPSENGYGAGHDKTEGHSPEERTSLKWLVRNAKGDAERSAIAQALEATRWNRKAAARLLNISYRGLLYKVQRYNLVPAAGSRHMHSYSGVREAKHFDPK